MKRDNVLPWRGPSPAIVRRFGHVIGDAVAILSPIDDSPRTRAALHHLLRDELGVRGNQIAETAPPLPAEGTVAALLHLAGAEYVWDLDRRAMGIDSGTARNDLNRCRTLLEDARDLLALRPDMGDAIQQQYALPALGLGTPAPQSVCRPEGVLEFLVAAAHRIDVAAVKPGRPVEWPTDNLIHRVADVLEALGEPVTTSATGGMFRPTGRRRGALLDRVARALLSYRQASVPDLSRALRRVVRARATRRR